MGISSDLHPPFAAFDTDTAGAMGLAFDTAWQVLMGTQSGLVSPLRAEETREALALRIITLAELGERDVFRLHDDANRVCPPTCRDRARTAARNAGRCRAS